MMNKALSFSLILVWLSVAVNGQTTLTLDECYDLLEKNFPAIKQKSLVAQQNQLETESVKKLKLPTLNLSAQATYQSDVTHVPIDNPMLSIPSPNKDQYKAVFSVMQPFYNGGIINAQIDAKTQEQLVEEKNIEATIYNLRHRVNQLYFSALLVQEQIKITAQSKKTVQTKLDEVNSAIDYGTAPKYTRTILEIELLKLLEKEEELKYTRKSITDGLAQLLGIQIEENTRFIQPQINFSSSQSISTPETELFNLQKQSIDFADNILARKNNPKLFGFANLGYGNPGINMLDNSFQSYYYVGIKFSWNVFDWNKTKKERMALALNKSIIDNKKEVFELNTTIQLKQQHNEIDKYNALIKLDNSIIEKQQEVVNAYETELQQGVITPSIYMLELNKLFEAKTTLKIHQIQLLLAIAEYNTYSGNKK